MMESETRLELFKKLQERRYIDMAIVIFVL